MDSTTFLTIAIPTFNRADILDISLGILIPQLIPYSDNIELIVSDNCSTDHTQAIIKKYQQKSDRIKFTINTQTENTGYYGNFVKCKQLSNGDYFWLLSDNEHLTSDAIEVLIDTMKSRPNCSAFFIDNSTHYDKNLIQKNKKVQFADDFFNSESAYMSTLISSVIFKNEKFNDDSIFLRFTDNLFIGFLLFCGCLTNMDLVCSLRYNIYTSFKSKVSFPLFKAWTQDILECVDFMVERRLLNENSKITFINGYVKTNLYSHVINYRKGISDSVVTESLNELRLLLNKSYSNNISYNKMIRPLLYNSLIVIYFIVIKNKIKNRLIKINFLIKKITDV